MKKIFRYILLLIVVYLVVEVFVYFITKTYYTDMNNYEILVESPKIEISESKISKKKGYIEGTATNDTGEIINDASIRFDFYNSQGVCVGSKLKEIGVFNATEKAKFDVKYDYKNVTHIKISIISD